MEPIEYKASLLARAVPDSEYRGDPDVTVSDIVYDSRKVRPEALFVCWKGAHYDGHAFAPDAVAKGAGALLCERYISTLRETPQIVVPDTRKALGPIASAFYGAPSERLSLIGVTGTNGKTTTTYLINGILQAARRKTGLIGTIENLIGQQTMPSERTTPEAPEIQRMLAEMVGESCTECTMEVSSHGLDLHRVDGCTFSIGVFTNLSQDHLDYHPTFEDYRDAKVRLFGRLTQAAVINADDPNGAHFAKAASVPIVYYGINAQGADFRATDIRLDPSGTSYVAHTPTGTIEIRLALTGLFNVYNSLGAIAVAHELGIRPEVIAQGLANVQVPGRFERVSDAHHPFSVIVDYAHTPDGLENVLRTARTIAQGRVVVVFGAGGDRDRSKRPVMGRVVAQLADHIVVTSDNPRSEDPQVICDEIEVGVRAEGAAHSFIRIVNRREAIRHAVESARPGDVVLIAGKGHETYQEIQGVRDHFDDREEARAALEERFGHAAAQTP